LISCPLWASRRELIGLTELDERALAGKGSSDPLIALIPGRSGCQANETRNTHLHRADQPQHHRALQCDALDKALAQARSREVGQSSGLLRRRDRPSLCGLYAARFESTALWQQRLVRRVILQGRNDTLDIALGLEAVGAIASSIQVQAYLSLVEHLHSTLEPRLREAAM
jgi:hypothetical protein